MTVVTRSGAGTTLSDMKERAEALVPRLRERANSAEQLRRLPDETVQDFAQAGLFRVLQPARFGGFELDYGRTQVELCHILGRGCGSSAWLQCVIACHAWCVGMFSQAAQEAVWGSDPGTLVASAFAFKTGRGRPVEGGYFIEGDWQFSSGSNLCQWIVLGTPIYEPDAQKPSRMLWCLLPERDWEIVDVWFAAGLKGTASNDIRVAGAFVPSEFTLDTSQCDGRPTPGSAINPSAMYRLPLWPIFPFNVSTPALGVARGALEAYVEYMGSRPERANMPQRQLRIAESACEIDAALALLRANLTSSPAPSMLANRWIRDSFQNQPGTQATPSNCAFKRSIVWRTRWVPMACSPTRRFNVPCAMCMPLPITPPTVLIWRESAMPGMRSDCQPCRCSSPRGPEARR
jgi:3-hydroxy-9,10-secoandrosta-1,3,5(10)-triene-9,17-dione monooxygenase